MQTAAALFTGQRTHLASQLQVTVEAPSSPAYSMQVRHYPSFPPCMLEIGF